VLQSNARYATFIILGGFVTSGLFNLGGDYLWNTINRGRLYKDLDPARWVNNLYKPSE